MLDSFSRGFFAPFRAIKLLFGNRTLLIRSAIPTLLNTVLLCILFYFSFSWILETAQGITKDLSGWLLWLSWILVLLVLFIASLLIGVVIFLIARIVAAPFNDPMAFATEKILGIDEVRESSGSIAKKLKAAQVEIVAECIKAARLGFLSLILALISLIPGAQFFTWPMMAMLLSVDFLDYPLARRGMNLNEQFRFHFSHFWASLGFGMGLTFIIPTPILGFFFLPLAVIGGTELFALEEKLKGTLSSSQ